MTFRQVVTLPRLRSALPPAACWVWTRAVLVMFTYKIVPYISQGDIVGDVKLYNQWSQIFAHGHFPHDPQWQYPPGAAIVIVLPRLLRSATGISYYSAFYLLALLSDLIIFLLVLYASWQTADRRAATTGSSNGGSRSSGTSGGSSSTANGTTAKGATTFGAGSAPTNGTVTSSTNPAAASGTGANGTGLAAPNGTTAADTGSSAFSGLSPISTPGSAARPGSPASSSSSASSVSSSTPGGAAISVRPDYTGLWAYTVAIFMIGPIVLGRYDIMVTMVATVALVAAGRSAAATWRMRGAAIGLGAALKLWPAAIAVGLPKRAHGRRALVWAVLAALVPAMALAVFLPGSMGFLTGQHDRGLEIESVPATLFLIARHFGYPARIRHQYGAFEVTGPGVSLVSTLSLVLTVAGFIWLLAVWRRKANLVPGRWTTALYYDAGLIAVLIAIVTSRVLSPQYLVWLVGLIALCLTLAPHASDAVVLESGAVSSAGTVLEPGTVVGSSALRGPGPSPSDRSDDEGRSVLTGPCWLLLAAISVTQVDFPLLFPRLIHDGRWAAWFLAGRNLLLVAAAVWGVVPLWRVVAPAPRPATRGEQAAVNAEPCSRVAQPEEQPAGQ